ncbi:MAG TPA: hypothetical protein VLV55_07265 [Rhizomicrobium sp.]|nr:hypothetical protein [Rhizomicrobium sp.]
MRADRPLSEHEGALFDAVCILARTVLELGADPKILNARLTEAMQSAEALGNSHGAETLGFLIRALFPSRDPEPQPESSTKPSLRIV